VRVARHEVLREVPGSVLVSQRIFGEERGEGAQRAEVFKKKAAPRKRRLKEVQKKKQKVVFLKEEEYNVIEAISPSLPQGRPLPHFARVRVRTSCLSGVAPCSIL
jgi:hypothetical protein